MFFILLITVNGCDANISAPLSLTCCKSFQNSYSFFETEYCFTRILYSDISRSEVLLAINNIGSLLIVEASPELTERTSTISDFLLLQQCSFISLAGITLPPFI